MKKKISLFVLLFLLVLTANFQTTNAAAKKNIYKIKVNIEGEETQVKLTLKTEISQKERKELKDALVEEWGLKENRICIQIVRNESGKMGNPVAHRSTSGSSGDACIQ